MNIWIVNQHAYTYTESAGTRHLSLGRELVEIGHEVTIVASSFYHKGRRYIRDASRIHEEWIAGVRFVWVPTRPYGVGLVARLVNHLQFALRARAWARRPKSEGPDIVIGSAPNHVSALAAAAIARYWRVPFVYEVRDLWPETLVDYSRLGRLHPGAPAFGLAERRLINQADHVITLLPGAEERIRRLARRDVRVSWLPNGVDLAFMRERGQDPAEAGGNGTEPLRVVYAGSHSMSNGLESVLVAAKYIQDRGSPVQFTLIGDGPAKPRLVTQANRLELRNVTFRNAVAKGEVYTEMRAADVLIANVPRKSVYRFGISLNKIFEYMAVGRPIILGYSGAYDPVAAARCGITVPADSAIGFADALDWLSDQAMETRGALGRAGVSYAEANHSYAVLAGRLSAVLEGCLDRD